MNTIRESRLKSTANGNVYHCAAYFVYCSQYILIDVFFFLDAAINMHLFIYLFMNQFLPRPSVCLWGLFNVLQKLYFGKNGPTFDEFGMKALKKSLYWLQLRKVLIFFRQRLYCMQSVTKLPEGSASPSVGNFTSSKKICEEGYSSKRYCISCLPLLKQKEYISKFPKVLF